VKGVEERRGNKERWGGGGGGGIVIKTRSFLSWLVHLKRFSPKTNGLN